MENTDKDMEEYFQRIGERIGELRRTNGQSISDLSKVSDIPVSRIEQWESGQGRALPVSDFIGLSEGLDVLFSFLTGKVPKVSVQSEIFAYFMGELPKGIQNMLISTMVQMTAETGKSGEIFTALLDDFAELGALDVQTCDRLKAEVEEKIKK